MKLSKVSTIGVSAIFACGLIMSSTPAPAESIKSANETLVGTIEVPAQGTCGGSFNPKIRGGEAHWTIDCINGNAGVNGWVKDTRSDGKCIQVKATWNDGTTKLSPRACPKNDKKSFELRGPGKTVKAYVFQS